MSKKTGNAHTIERREQRRRQKARRGEGNLSSLQAPTVEINYKIPQPVRLQLLKKKIGRLSLGVPWGKER